MRQHWPPIGGQDSRLYIRRGVTWHIAMQYFDAYPSCSRTASFQVLVTEPPKVPLPSSVADYRGGLRYVRCSQSDRRRPFTKRRRCDHRAARCLPLKAVRELAKESHASEKYIGFRNPLLDGNTDNIADQETTAKGFEAAKLARDARCEPEHPMQTASLADPEVGGLRVTRCPDGLVDVGDLRNGHRYRKLRRKYVVWPTSLALVPGRRLHRCRQRSSTCPMRASLQNTRSFILPLMSALSDQLSPTLSRD
jgi:hypothetical protein